MKQHIQSIGTRKGTRKKFLDIFQRFSLNFLHFRSANRHYLLPISSCWYDYVWLCTGKANASINWCHYSQWFSSNLGKFIELETLDWSSLSTVIPIILLEFSFTSYRKRKATCQRVKRAKEKSHLKKYFSDSRAPFYMNRDEIVKRDLFNLKISPLCLEVQRWRCRNCS